MPFREFFTACSKGDQMAGFWLLVDVTSLPGVTPGDAATLIGTDGQQQIHAEDIARQCGTITNEILSRLSARLPIVTTE